MTIFKDYGFVNFHVIRRFREARGFIQNWILWQRFHKDCESLCFDCGEESDLTVIGAGVALCPKCLEEEEENHV